MKRTAIYFLLCVFFALSGCGNKAPLRLPDTSQLLWQMLSQPLQRSQPSPSWKPSHS
ncbi:MAG: LPS translocon maturation chaperone LptM [Gammaproteobacteria bacterium WSBS_2016_MAG_OTU1]